MFFILNGVGSPFGRQVSIVKREWSETGLGRPMRWVLGSFSIHSRVTKKPSSVARSIFFKI